MTKQDKAIIEHHDFGCRRRAAIELTIVHMVIQDAHKADYLLAVDDGDTPEPFTIMCESDLIDMIFNLDDCFLFFYRPTDYGVPSDTYGLSDDGGSAIWLADTKTPIGWVRFVMGNDGYDVINDYTTNLEKVLKRANQVADAGYLS